MCVVYAVPKTVKIKPRITKVSTEMWNGKIFSARERVLVLQHLWMCAQTARAKQLPFVRSKTSCTGSICRWTCTPKGHPDQWRGLRMYKCHMFSCHMLSLSARLGCPPSWLVVGTSPSPSSHPVRSSGRKTFQLELCSLSPLRWVTRLGKGFQIRQHSRESRDAAENRRGEGKANSPTLDSWAW